MRGNFSMVTLETGLQLELSGAASRLLADLEARDYLDDPCWLVERMDGRLALYVPVDYSGTPERLRAVTKAAADELEERGLIDRERPARNACTLAYRDCRDTYLGWPVRLTDIGRQRLRRVGAR